MHTYPSPTISVRRISKSKPGYSGASVLKAGCHMLFVGRLKGCFREAVDSRGLGSLIG